MNQIPDLPTRNTHPAPRLILLSPPQPSAERNTSSRRNQHRRAARTRTPPEGFDPSAGLERWGRTDGRLHRRTRCSTRSFTCISTCRNPSGLAQLLAGRKTRLSTILRDKSQLRQYALRPHPAHQDFTARHRPAGLRLPRGGTASGCHTHLTPARTPTAYEALHRADSHGAAEHHSTPEG